MGWTRCGAAASRTGGGRVRAIGLGVQLAEVAYPSLAGPARAPDCLRCDIVVTERLADLRVSDAHSRRRRADSPHSLRRVAPEHLATGGLPLAGSEEPSGSSRSPTAFPAPTALQLQELIGSVMRCGEAGKDARIEHGAVLVVVFSESREVAEHDIAIAVRRSLDRTAPIGVFPFRTLRLRIASATRSRRRRFSKSPADQPGSSVGIPVRVRGTSRLSRRWAGRRYARCDPPPAGRRGDLRTARAPA